MTRSRRSHLFMPGSNPRALEKARNLPSDGLILDLEDSVAPDAKAVARDQIAEAIAAKGLGKRDILIRTNGLDTSWWSDDVAMAAKASPDRILVPKVSSHGPRHDRPSPGRARRSASSEGLGHDRDCARGAARGGAGGKLTR
ncbi:citrate lyase beta subunit [Bradyrhizobium sp. USDA 4529]